MTSIYSAIKSVEHTVGSAFAVAYGLLFLNQTNDINAIDVAGGVIKNRDDLFRLVLTQFNRKPVRIFQIGAIETFKNEWRIFSGWSDLIFGEYIRQHGGKLTIADIDLDHIALSIVAANELKYDATFFYGDAIEVMGQENYDIYYLDGSNDPQETLDQFNKIKHQRCIVLVDDFSVKGTLLAEAGYDFAVQDVVNGFGILDLRNQE